MPLIFKKLFFKTEQNAQMTQNKFVLKLRVLILVTTSIQIYVINSETQ